MRCMEELEQDMELLGVTGVEGIFVFNLHTYVDKL